jgi:chromosome segregation ATPase
MVDEAHPAIPRQPSRRRKKHPETGSTNRASDSVPDATERPATAEPRENGIQLLPQPRAILSPDTRNLADAVRAIVSPLQDMLEREIAERRTLQAQADQLLAKLAATQVELAEATSNVQIGHVKWEAAESRAAEAVSKVMAAEARVEAAQAKTIELQRRVDALRLELERPPKRRWWLF